MTSLSHSQACAAGPRRFHVNAIQWTQFKSQKKFWTRQRSLNSIHQSAAAPVIVKRNTPGQCRSILAL